ncbi:polysaccharide polymerase [Oenococcus oeni]|uniref:polysaccharide polymerase n=1 Tax=Oenococcus oeni TaxID=1247 RepID=UPI0010B25FF1|nr:polysaccharide polymerase [Oenococcus oeni]SYW09691.1 putative Polysaccharide polymerase [Oenococcus oeni]
MQTTQNVPGIAKIEESELMTRAFSILAVVLSISGLLSGLGTISSNLLNLIQATAVFLVYLYVCYFKNLDLVDLAFILLSFLIAALNRAPYMVSVSMMLMIMAMAYKNDGLDYRKILSVYVKSCILVFSVIVCAYYVFNFNNHDVTMWRIDKLIYRKSIGFDHPNVAMMEFLGIIYGFLGLLKTKKRKRHLLLLILLSYLIYTQTVSRTSTILILAALVFIFLLGRKVDQPMPVWLSKAISLAPLGLMVISLYVLFHSYSDQLNTLLSGRLALYQQYYQEYGIHFLKTPELENAMFDSGYLQSLLSKGGLFSLQLMLVLTYMGWHAKKMTWKAGILLLSFFVLGFTETALQHFELFFPIVLILADNDVKRR